MSINAMTHKYLSNPWVSLTQKTTLHELISSGYAGSVNQMTTAQPRGIFLLGAVGFDPRQQRFVLLRIATLFSQSPEIRLEIGLPQLTEREQEVLQLVATGTSNVQIARRLFISQHTVKVHLRHIFEKLKVQSRTEAVMKALRQGWISLPHSLDVSL